MAKKYVVKAGDSLSKIAQEFYGDAKRWKEIHEANKDKIKNPDALQAGWELVIPGVEDASAKAKPAGLSPLDPDTDAQSKLGKPKAV